jgi:hypothetical protein
MPQNFEKPVVGYNHNIKHRGKLFHVQTEDSGVKNPHVITHVFVGGNVIATKKISYEDILDAENLPDAVRQLMEMQHKEILRNLINGVYDDLDSATMTPYYQPGEIAPPANPPPAPPLIPLRRIAESPRSATVLKPLAPKAPAAKNAPLPPKPKESPVDPLFGEDLISEKSLDEVILNYLADDKDQ